MTHFFFFFLLLKKKKNIKLIIILYKKIFQLFINSLIRIFIILLYLTTYLSNFRIEII